MTPTTISRGSGGQKVAHGKTQSVAAVGTLTPQRTSAPAGAKVTSPATYARWRKAKIGEVCDLATGGTPSRAKPDYFGGDIKWLVSGDIHQGEIFDCQGRITTEGMQNSNTKILPMNSVMIALNGQGKTRGTVALLRTEATCNQSMVSISPKESSDLLPEFLYANLHGRYEEIRLMTSDDDKDRRGLNMGIIRNIEIPIAPIPEQHRIVAILDKAFAAIATAKANTEKNLQNVSAIFDSRCESIFSAAVTKWGEKLLSDICYVDRGSSPRPIKNFLTTRDDGVNWIKIGDTTEGDKYITSTAQKITREGAKESVLVEPGDFVLTNSMSFGRAYIMQITGYIHDGWYCLRLNEGINADYLYYLLSSKYVRQQFNRLASGSVVLNISSDLVKQARLPMPPPEVQLDLVRVLDELRNETQRLTSLYHQKLTALDALKKSLLHHAFTGQL